MYVSTNLLVSENVDRLEQLMRDAAGLGFTHLLLADSKFSRLHEMDERYFRHVERVRQLSDELQLRLVPAIFPVGYSNDLLAQNPNLAEGLPVRDALFEVRGSRAELVADPAVGLPSLGDRKAWNFVDESLRAEGEVLRVSDPKGENCRVMKTVHVGAIPALSCVCPSEDSGLSGSAADCRAGCCQRSAAESYESACGTHIRLDDAAYHI